MRPVSAAFGPAVRASHQAVVKVEVLDLGTVVQTITTSPAAVTSGSVSLDARAASRGRFDLTIVDDGSLGLIPTTAAGLLAPYGNEVRISRGLILPTGVTETPSIGVFRIDAARIDDSADSLTINLSGMDRSARVIDARFEEPYEIASGTLVETAIRNLVTYAIPDVVTVFPGATYTTPALRAEEGDDRWKLAQDLATASGLELFFDGDGALRLQALAGGGTVTTLAEGSTGVLLSASRNWVREGSYNAVVATGENTGATTPARGVAYDIDPTSPTYYYGPFGKVPMFFQSAFIVTNDQALAAATAMLQRQLGTTQTATFGTIVNPSLEPGDTVRVTRLRAGIDEELAIDTLTIPLSADQPMTGQTRARQVTP